MVWLAWATGAYCGCWDLGVSDGGPMREQKRGLGKCGAPVPASLAISRFPAFLLADDAEFPANAVPGRIHCRNALLDSSTEHWPRRPRSGLIAWAHVPSASHRPVANRDAVTVLFRLRMTAKASKKKKNGRGLDRSRSDFAGPKRNKSRRLPVALVTRFPSFPLFLFHLARYYSPLGFLDESTASDMLSLTNTLPPYRSLPER